MFLVDVIDARALPNRKLALRFSDGREGVVAVDDIVDAYTGVFAPLRDPNYFASVSVDRELGTVVWPSGADLCPDVLYARVTGQVAALDSVGTKTSPVP